MVIKDFQCTSCSDEFEDTVDMDEVEVKCPYCGNIAFSICNGGTKVEPNGIGLDHRDYTGQIKMSFGGEIRGEVDVNGNELPPRQLDGKLFEKLNDHEAFQESVNRKKNERKSIFFDNATRRGKTR